MEYGLCGEVIRIVFFTTFYIFSEGSPELFTIDFYVASPYPPYVVNSDPPATYNLQISLKEEMPVGSLVDIEVVIEGIIPIKVPCLDYEGVLVGSW